VHYHLKRAGVFKQLQDLDADKLTQLGKGSSGIGVGIPLPS
jgi:hypothetical protein